MDRPATSGCGGLERSGSRAAPAAAVLGFFVITLDAVIVNVALPSITRDLGGGITGLQWVVDGYTLLFAALLLWAGSLSGRRSSTLERHREGEHHDQLDQRRPEPDRAVTPRRRDGTHRAPTTIWVVRDGDDLFVRSWRGSRGAWFTDARFTHGGHVPAGGVSRDVTFTEEDDPAVYDRVDNAYRTKYGRHSGYVEPMVADTARTTILRLLRR
ncbi:DUF2255 family protein [Actinomadura rugatobispora]|uniref:DUF2255 family protein n=1 Tax=Actinomadura rugatobispora TaxID=1994 RepID=A0ABW0ZSR5_9ACTN|nr:hypothetical protein GCM10010200_035350 [Actinomadura rugatobispora]